MVSNYQAGEGRRAAVSRGQTARRQAGAGAESPCIRRESVALVMLVAGIVAASARAQHEDDVGAAMPADGDTGGRQTRTVQGGVMRRVAGSGRRASGAGGAQRRGVHLPLTSAAEAFKLSNCQE